MNTRSMIEARNLITTVRSQGELVLHGMAALATVREAILLLSEASGFHLEFDPASDPTLVDYLTVAGGGAFEGGLMGGALGLFLGVLVNRPLEGAAIGAGIGATIGVMHGLDGVARGWRVRARILADGSPSLFIHEV